MLTAAVCYLALYTAPDYRKNLDTFMEVERSFARTCAMAGIRASFMEWFAEDGIGFNPGPVKQKEAYAKLPAEEKPFKTLLTWEPKIADCSSIGDMGFTTGPFKVIDLSGSQKPVQNGAYFSVWRKQKDGMMRVVLDFGTPMGAAPVYPPKMKVLAPPSPALVTMDLIDRARQTIAGFENDIAKSKAEELSKTLAFTYSPNPVVYRPGQGPILTFAEATKWWEGASLTLKSWDVTYTGISESGDFAYCYGKYAGEQGGKPTNGYFAHVWKCVVGKGWQLVGDVMSVAPATEDQRQG